MQKENGPRSFARSPYRKNLAHLDRKARDGRTYRAQRLGCSERNRGSAPERTDPNNAEGTSFSTIPRQKAPKGNVEDAGLHFEGFVFVFKAQARKSKEEGGGPETSSGSLPFFQ